MKRQFQRILPLLLLLALIFMAAGLALWLAFFTDHTFSNDLRDRDRQHEPAAANRM